MTRRGLAVLLVVAAIAGGCREDAPAPEPIQPIMALDSALVLVVNGADTVRVAVEVAETEQERSIGLMHRTSLADNAGMIFLFDSVQPAEGTFWMFNTLIPLDIAFIGPDGRIGSIRHMEPCSSPVAQYCPTYQSGVPFQTALEVNAGFFAANGVEVGDTVVLQR